MGFKVKAMQVVFFTPLGKIRLKIRRPAVCAPSISLSHPVFMLDDTLAKVVYFSVGKAAQVNPSRCNVCIAEYL
jgi:hypothetical protein